MTIEDNVKINKDIADLFEIFGESSERFWWKLLERIKEEKLPLQESKPEEKEMTDAQAKAFGERIISFGAHTGEQLKDLDLSYLCNLTDPSTFMKNMKKYTTWRAKRE